MAMVIRVRFKRAAKLYDFDPNGLDLHNGMSVVTETARGVELSDEERFGRRGEAAFARDGEHELSVSGIHEHLREGRGERWGRRPKLRQEP